MSGEFVLGVDLDGVVADFYPALRETFAEWRGVPVTSLPTQFGPDLAEWGAQPGEYEQVHRFAVTQRDLFRRLDVVPGAPQALRRLSEAGVRIRIITHRLYIANTHVAAVSQTVAWLDHHAIPYWDLCFMRDKSKVGADLYVDDGPHNIRALQDAGREVIAFTAPPNENMKPPPVLRAHSWEQVEHLVRDGHAAWQGQRDHAEQTRGQRPASVLRRAETPDAPCIGAAAEKSTLPEQRAERILPLPGCARSPYSAVR